MPEPDFLIRQGDTASIISATLRDDDGDPVDIEDAGIRFHMAPIQGGSPVVDGSAVNDQGEAASTFGNVSYSWGTADTATPGLYLAEWQVTFSGGRIQTFPNDAYVLVRITPEVS